MSGQLRFAFAAFVIAAGFSTPAASNALTDLFSPQPAPEAAPATPAPAKDECLQQPGSSTASGQRWVYRYDGHRKCWFQADASTAPARKAVRHQPARQRITAPEQDDSAARGQQEKAVEDAHAEMQNAAPADTPQLTPPGPTLKIVRTIRVTDAEAQVPPPPVLAQPDSDQPASNESASAQPAPGQPASSQATPRRVDVDKLLAEAPAANDEVASAVAAPTIAGLGARMSSVQEWMSGVQDWMTRWLGALLMVLGGVALLLSSRTLRRALWLVRSKDHGEELPVVAYEPRSDPSFRTIAPYRPAPPEPEIADDDWLEGLRGLETLSRGGVAR